MGGEQNELAGPDLGDGKRLAFATIFRDQTRLAAEIEIEAGRRPR